MPAASAAADPYLAGAFIVLPGDTIAEMLFARVRQDGERAALLQLGGGPQGAPTLHWRSWSEVERDVLRAAAALRRLGAEPGDRIAHLAENRYEWLVADLAMHCLGAIHVPLHATLSGWQVAQQIQHSGAGIAIVSTAEQAEKVDSAERVGQPPFAGQRLIYDADPQTAAWAPWLPQLEASTDAECAAIQAGVARAVDASSVATILYTSGTTGDPKGVVLTHHNLVSNAKGVCQAFGSNPEEVRMAFLPLSHIFARTCDLYAWIARGAALAQARSRESVLADCQIVRPTTLNGVPYFFELVRRAARAAPDPATAVQQVLGGRIEYCCSGGAPLPADLYDYFAAQGVPLLQGYGLTESSPVISAATPQSDRRGASGPALPGVEVRIADDGEILTRGPHVMRGYYREPDATAEVLRDRWLHTGDLGRVDEDGFVWVTGRKKEILVTAGGKNVAPSLLESLLTGDDLIVQAVIVGDGRSWLGALIFPDAKRLEAATAAAQEAGRECSREAIVLGRVEQRLQNLSRHEQVRKVALLDRPLSIEQGELTPKLSLRRSRIMENWAALVEQLYARDDETV